MTAIFFVNDQVWVYHLVPPKKVDPKTAVETMRTFATQHLDEVLMGNHNKLVIQQSPTVDNLELLFSLQYPPKKKEVKEEKKEEKKKPERKPLQYLTLPPNPKDIMNAAGNLKLRRGNVREYVRALRGYTLREVNGIDYNFTTQDIDADTRDDLFDMWKAFDQSHIGSTLNVTGVPGKRAAIIGGMNNVIWTGAIREKKHLFRRKKIFLEVSLHSQRLDKILEPKETLLALDLEKYAKPGMRKYFYI